MIRSKIEIFNVKTMSRTCVCKLDTHIEAPNWLKDNKLLYNSNGLLYEYDMNAHTHTQIDTGYACRCNNDHLPSFDNKYIAISHGTEEDGQSRVYIISRAGGSPRLITALAPSYLHGWSPDGSMLCYCAERNGDYDIYCIPAEGGVERQLTHSPGLDDGCEYSPDGTHIWFNSVRSGLMQIWRMRADGSDQIQMTFEDSNNWFPHVSPDGKKIVYLSYKREEVEPGSHPANKNVELRLMNAEGGKSVKLAEVFGGQGTINVNSWAADSERFAFISYEVM